MKKLLMQLRGRIHAKINVPGVNVDIHTRDSPVALREIRKILDALRAASGGEEYDDITLESTPRHPLWSMSDEARSIPEFMDFVKLASKAEEQMTYKRLSFANKRVIDISTNKSSVILDVADAKKQIRHALKDVNPKDVKFIGVHVMGAIDDDEKRLICDEVAQRIGKGDVRVSFTNKDVLGKTVAEVLLFGRLVEEFY